MATLLIVTGASRGLGRAFSLAFMRGEKTATISPVRALLVARSEDDLIKTKTLMQEEANKNVVSLDVSYHLINLGDLENLEKNVDDLFQAVLPRTQYHRTILINNAGSIGPLSQVKKFSSFGELKQEIDFNVTSSFWVSSRFAHYFGKEESEDGEKLDDTSSCTIVNVSSLCALQPFKTMGLYCANKAARDMFHAALAAEENNTLQVLSYAPGACDTNMQEYMRCSEGLDKDIKEFFIKAKKDESLIQSDDTADSLVKLVLNGNFKSGEHKDYWDLVQNLET